MCLGKNTTPQEKEKRRKAQRNSERFTVVLAQSAVSTMMADPPSAKQEASSAKPENDAAEAAYIDSCLELKTAITSLEASLTAFVGKDNMQAEVMAHTKARLTSELAQR